MLNTLDLIIAFAVIMSVLSLLITIVVQMVSAALALRGKNLANALALTFQTIDPRMAEHAHSLAAQILRDPIFCDSIWRPKNRSALPFVNGATQAVIDAERTLREAEQALAANQNPALIQQLESAVKKAKDDLETEKSKPGVLVRKVEPNRQKPWRFWTWPGKGARHLGNAIRPGEIYRVLCDFANLTETEAALRDIPSELSKKAALLVQTLGKIDQPAKESQIKLRVISKVTEFFKDPGQQRAVVDSLGNFGATVERATTQAYDRFQRWFGSAQDRAEQWFQTHVRVVTIVIAILTAFLFQLDTVDIYRQLRDEPKLVAALVKSAPEILEKGGVVLDPTNTPAYYMYLLWLQKHPLFPLKTLPPRGDEAAFRQALADRLKENPDAEFPLQEFDRTVASARNAPGFSDRSESAGVETAYTAWLKNFPTLKLEGAPDFATATAADIRTKIQTKIQEDASAKAAPTPENASAWLAEYDGLKTEGTMAFEKAREATFNDLQRKLDEAGFDLAPSPLLSRWDKENVPNWGRKCPLLAHYLVHLLGVLMTAGLLALGAPFWFNLLKNLTSLRPAVAALIEKRPTSAPASPKTPPTSS